MTKSSAARIAARAVRCDEPIVLHGQRVPVVDQAFRLPVDGQLSERIDLIPYELVLGLIHPEGSPILVAVWNGHGFKMLLPEEASRWADELIAAGQAVPLAPVIAAIRKLVRRVGEIVTASIMGAETVH